MYGTNVAYQIDTFYSSSSEQSILQVRGTEPPCSAGKEHSLTSSEATTVESVRYQYEARSQKDDLTAFAVA